VQSSKIQKENAPERYDQRKVAKLEAPLPLANTHEDQLLTWCTCLAVMAAAIGFATTIWVMQKTEAFSEWSVSSPCKQAFEKIAKLIASDVFYEVSQISAVLGTLCSTACTLLQGAIQTVLKLPFKAMSCHMALLLWTTIDATSVLSASGVIAGLVLYNFKSQKWTKNA